jgi:hypothetical protein
VFLDIHENGGDSLALDAQVSAVPMARPIPTLSSDQSAVISG